ncbi:sensor histidine kinase [Pseudofulvibacter geojedonensis]|uniref:Histidine kinase n=1 Tax=Pseudofulvibacter geojedonensis TaxID=1123758 RepID=A0ABW3I304_9FLAO
MKQISIIFLLLIINYSFSQNQNYINFSLKDGLASNEIYDIYQDDINGYLWFSSDRGLSQYNGYEFKNYGKNQGVPGNVIFDFFPQTNNQIWCWTKHTNKLFYFQKGSDKFIEYKHNYLLEEVITSPYQIIKSIYLDEEGNLHLAGQKIVGNIIISNEGKLIKKPKILPKKNEKLYVTIDKDNKYSYIDNTGNFNYNLDQGFIDNISFSKNVFVMLYNNKVAIINKHKKDIELTKFKNKPITIDKVGNDKIAINFIEGGVSIYDLEGNIKKSFLQKKTCTSFFIDHEGGYWFSTLKSGVFYVASPEIDCISIGSEEVQSMIKLNNDDLVLGFASGNVIRRSKSGKNKKIYESRLPTPSLVEYDRANDDLYFISDNKLFRNISNTNVKTYALGLSKPEKGVILLSSIGKVIKVKNDTVQEVKLPYRCLDASMYNDQMFVGTPKGLFKIFNDTVQKINHEALDCRIQDLEVDREKDKLFIATIGNGVVIYSNGNFESITNKDGLLSNNIEEIHFENDENIWIITDKGINRILLLNNHRSIEGVSFKNIGYNNKITDLEVIGDSLFLGTSKGLLKMHKNILNKHYINNPRLKIKEVLINDSIILNQSNVELLHNQNRITFNLEGVSFKDDLIYKYRLLGLNDKWYYSKNREITFASLPPGNYIFNASCLNQKELHKTISYEFQISKPYWKEWWFYSVATIIVLFLITLFFYLKLQTEKSKTQNVIIEQKLLRSQMTPHFIFNSLSVLQGMILNKEEKKSVLYISKFSKLLRIILENSRDKMVLLSEELLAIENYLTLQNLESNMYSYTISTDNTVNTSLFKIPPMLIQPFVENAIEHAFANQQKDRSVDIRLTYSNKNLICTVTDNGIGIESLKYNKNRYKKSLSTAITSERLQMLSKDFKMKGSVSLEDRKKYNEQGTIATLVVPYIIIN